MKACPELRRLSAEHDGWLAEVARLGREGAGDRASRLLALWDREVLPHCRSEEDVLLPELAGEVSEADALVVFTLGDHVVLRRLARELRAAEGPARPAAADALARKLVEHVAFEERTLFPALRDALGRARLAGLAGEIAGAARHRNPRPADGPPAANPQANERKHP